MKALRRKDTKEWLTTIGRSGALYTGNIPKEVTDRMESVEQIQRHENMGRGASSSIDLTDYELVEIEIVVKQIVDGNTGADT